MAQAPACSEGVKESELAMSHNRVK